MTTTNQIPAPLQVSAQTEKMSVVASGQTGAFYAAETVELTRWFRNARIQ